VPGLTALQILPAVPGRCNRAPPAPTASVQCGAWPVRRYLDDAAYRAMVVEVLDARRHSVDALQLYLEDPVFDAPSVRVGTNADLHRQYVAFLRRSMREAPAGEERRAVAARLCRVAGLMQESAGERDREGFTPLMRAANAGASMAVLGPLVAAGGDVDAVSELSASGRRGWTALMRAAVAGYTETAAALCALGANVNAMGAGRETALFVAAQFGHGDVVEALLRAGADMELANEEGVTPLIVAAQDGRVEAVRALVATGARLDTLDEQGATALIMAAYDGRLEVVQCLCEAGARLDIKAGRWTALQAAKSNRHTAVAEYLRGREAA
jgi:hypothetical protein